MRSFSGEPGYFISIIEDITERKLAELVPDPLTRRELEVLGLVARGKTNPEISGDLPYSEGTVKLDLQHAFAKLGVSNRRKAVERAIDIGLIPPP